VLLGDRSRGRGGGTVVVVVVVVGRGSGGRGEEVMEESCEGDGRESGGEDGEGGGAGR